MMAFLAAVAAAAVERFINKRRLKLHEVLSDLGWLTLIFALIEFAYLFVVESGTLAYGSAVRPLWYTEWAVFKDLFFNAAVGVLLILTSVWLESAGLRIELRRPAPRPATAAAVRLKVGGGKMRRGGRCDIEWHESS
jgi:hypothetical protein